MKHTTGSILSFTALPGYVVRLTADDGESWTETMLGLAVAVRWRDDDDVECDLVPVLLDTAEGLPVTVRDLLLDRPGVRWQMVADRERVTA